MSEVAADKRRVVPDAHFSAAQDVSATLAGLAAGCPPRDVLPLYLEALQLSCTTDDEGDGDARGAPEAWHLRAALTRGVALLVSRTPRRRWEAAANAERQVLEAVRQAVHVLAQNGALQGDCDDCAVLGGATATLAAALQFVDAASSAADAAAEPNAAAHGLPRLLLRALAAGASHLPAGASHPQLLPLRRLLHARGVTSWKALDAATAQPPRREADSDSDEPDDADEAQVARERADENRDVIVGAALLAHAWLTGQCEEHRGPDDSTGRLLPAATYATELLSGAAGVNAAALGADLAAAACRTVAASASVSSSGAPAEAMSQLLTSLTSAMAQSPSPDVRERAYAALLQCLDVHAPWVRLEALRTLLKTCSAPAVAALLFRRLKDDAAAAWPQPPFGGPPAARFVLEWLKDAATDVTAESLHDDWQRALSLAEVADAVIGALNALRFVLLRDASARHNVSSLATRESLDAVRTKVLQPLQAAAVTAAAALAAAPLDMQCQPAMLAAQTLHQLTERTQEAVDAAAAACSHDEGQNAEPATVSGLKRGFFA